VPIPFVQRDFPLGTIQSWYGSIASIPGTWRLCDGTLKTPDLRNKFIIGAGDSYAVNAVGGSLNHNHDFTSAAHNHQFVIGAGLGAGANYDRIVSTESITGTTDNKSSLPPYHSLAYIMYAGRVH